MNYPGWDDRHNQAKKIVLRLRGEIEYDMRAAHEQIGFLDKTVAIKADIQKLRKKIENDEKKRNRKDESMFMMEPHMD